MAFLRNKNGSNYEILASRKSKYYEGHKDYLVRHRESGGVTAVRGWKPKNKEWEHSSFIGFLGNGDNTDIYRAKQNFKKRKDEKY